MPQLGVASETSTVALQVGYSIADILAKCAYGFMIVAIAKAKMEDEAVTSTNDVSVVPSNAAAA